MKKIAIILGVFSVVGFTSCKKCHECHYDMNGSEVELGEYCGDDLEAIEANGHVDAAGVTQEVHCGEDH